MTFRLDFQLVWMMDSYFLEMVELGKNAPPDVNKSRIHIYKLQNGQFNLFQIIKQDGNDWLGKTVKYHNNQLYAYVANGVIILYIGK
ncbi:MAG: hypothetical protein U5M51_08625 [Emticicia sp.]|nr:hypothetical protein [Emticicia sp.]